MPWVLVPPYRTIQHCRVESTGGGFGSPTLHKGKSICKDHPINMIYVWQSSILGISRNYRIREIQ